MRFIVFWGHGQWDPSEKPTHTFVPTNSSLYFFARHREEIDTNRMRDIVTTLRLTTGVNRVADFKRDMKDMRALRNVKPGGSRVRNYRLLPSDDRTWMDAEERDAAPDAYELVQTTKPEGETLSKLFIRHGAPGAIFLWVPCRAVDGQSFVDSGNASTTHAVDLTVTTVDDFGQRITTHKPGQTRGPDYSRKVT